MPKTKTGNIQQRGNLSFRIRYVDSKGIRRHETLRGTFQEAQELLKRRLETNVSELPPYTPQIYRHKKLKSVAECSGVYFLWCRETGLTKIGHSAGAGRRVADITSASSSQLQLIGFLPTFHHTRAEKIIHEFLHHRRVRGEWFRIT